MMDEAQAKEVLAGAAAPPRAKTGQLTDPPDLAQYAQRGDPPMSEWPGRIVGRKDLMMASGDPRDWFRYRPQGAGIQRGVGLSSPMPATAARTSWPTSLGTRFWCSGITGRARLPWVPT